MQAASHRSDETQDSGYGDGDGDGDDHEGAYWAMYHVPPQAPISHDSEGMWNGDGGGFVAEESSFQYSTIVCGLF